VFIETHNLNHLKNISVSENSQTWKSNMAPFVFRSKSGNLAYTDRSVMAGAGVGGHLGRDERDYLVCWKFSGS
jgi:hypothetical protein